MKNSEVLKLVKDRDKLIDILILSHIYSLGTQYSLDSPTGMKIASKSAINYFAKDEIIDEKIMNESVRIMNMPIPDQEKINLIFCEKRAEELSKSLSELVKRIRISALKDFDKKEYVTKY